MGLSAFDWMLVTGMLWIFALTLAARTWVKLNEHKLVGIGRLRYQDDNPGYVDLQDAGSGYAGSAPAAGDAAAFEGERDAASDDPRTVIVQAAKSGSR